MMVDITCTNCGIVFGVWKDWIDARKRDYRTFYCPNGHSLSYTQGSSEEDQLRRERDRLKQQLAQRDDAIRVANGFREAAEHREAAQKANVTKLKKRAGAGVCPCCNRTFLALQKHMQDRHPEFTDEDGNNVVPIRRTKIKCA